MTQSDRSRLHAVDIDALELMVALRAASGTVPDEHVDWGAFHRRLSSRAELPLARLRHPLTAARATTGVVRAMPIRRAPKRVHSAWWEHTARWSRLTVGSALAAGAVLVAVIRLTPKDMVDQVDGSITTQSTDADGTRAAFESAVIGRTRVRRWDGRTDGPGGGPGRPNDGGGAPDRGAISHPPAPRDVPRRPEDANRSTTP